MQSQSQGGSEPLGTTVTHELKVSGSRSPEQAWEASLQGRCRRKPRGGALEVRLSILSIVL